MNRSSSGPAQSPMVRTSWVDGSFLPPRKFQFRGSRRRGRIVIRVACVCPRALWRGLLWGKVLYGTLL